MKKLVEFKLDNEETILVEIEAESNERSSSRIGADSYPEKAKKSISKSLNIIAPILKTISKKANNIIDKPDEVEIEIGFKFSAEAGIVIASSSTEGHITVKLKWIKEMPSNA